MSEIHSQDIEMREFGLSLTGRPYGKDCFEKLSRRNLKPPFVLDFKGVITMGSSFGEEVVVPLAQADVTKAISIKSANNSILDCLQKIQLDFGLKINFL